MSLEYEYNQEINDLFFEIQRLKEKHYYEKTGVKTDGYLLNDLIKIKKNLDSLIERVDGKKPDKDSITNHMLENL